MQLRINFLVFFFMVAFLQSACSQEDIQENTFQKKYTTLNTAYQASLQTQNGMTIDFAKNWGNKYWKLVKENPNHKRAPEVAKRAFSLYEKMNNPAIYRKKLNELSVDDRALMGILTYWNRVLYNGIDQSPAHPYARKLQTIAEQSRTEAVKIASRYHLAQFYIKFKYYEEAVTQLKILALDHQVYDTHPTYGKGIQKMQAAARYSAGKTMPAFELDMLSGESFTKKDLENHVTFFYFYGSTCGSCVAMYPKITRIHRSYSDEGLQVIGFGNDWHASYGFNTPKEFQVFAQEYNISWPQAIDYSIWEKMGVVALSTGYLIDGKGQIVRISRSETVSDAMEGYKKTTLEEAVVKLLKKI